MTTRLLRISGVQLIVPLSTSTIYKKMAAGEFPRPCHMPGTTIAAWLESDIEQWIRDRVAARNVLDQKKMEAR